LGTEALEPRRLLAVLVTTSADTVDPDDGVFSLRERLIDHAASNPTTPLTVHFDAGISTIQLDSEELLVSSHVHIAGPGHNVLEIIAAPGSRVFQIDSSANATISGLSITGGDTESYGAGIAVDGGTLELNRVRVYDNIARVTSPSVHGGGGIQVNNGTLHVIESTIDQNQAFSGAGVMSFNGVVTIERSTIASNSSVGVADTGTGNLGGGIAAFGGSTHVLTVLNSTISGNTAGNGAGVAIRRGPAELVNVTITENEANVAGGGVTGGIVTFDGSDVSLHNSIVAGNISSSPMHANARIYLGSNISKSYNIVGPGADGYSRGMGDKMNVLDAGLLPLGNYGGPTQTHALSSDSVAIDTGDNLVASSAGLSFDQRGTGFDRIEGPRVDIGAVERMENMATLTISEASAAEGNRLEFAVALDIAVEGGVTVGVTFVDETATGSESYAGASDYHNAPHKLEFEGNAGEVQMLSIPTWNDSVAEENETLGVRLSAENILVDASAQATGTILEFGSAIALPAGETRVTNEDGAIYVRHGANVLFQAPRQDVATLKFDGGQHNTSLSVGDLGTHLGLEVAIEYDGGDGNDQFQSTNLTERLDLNNPLYQLTNVEQINVPTGIDVTITRDDVNRISADNRLVVRVEGDTEVPLDGSWLRAEPNFNGSEAVYQATLDQAILQLTSENAWHNPFLVADVNRDDAVTTADALLIINSLAREGERALATPDQVADFPAFSYDVSGDQRISALDALRTINVLNRQGVEPSQPAQGSVYSIGNSLTQDMLPAQLDQDPAWHIFCSKNLAYINDNPDGHCVDSSTPWPEALDQNQYDWLVIQPFDGTTLDEDVSVISSWITMQPSAKIVLHTGWARHADFAMVFEEGNPDNEMRPNREYFEALISALRDQHPQRDFTSTHAFDLLNEISIDTQSGLGPYGTLSHIYRDFVHLSRNEGRYLMHNLLRMSVGQAASSEGFDINPIVRAYLDSKLQVL
tara:strand:- start:138174 stop:141119 length:2946 start_codon:yes stop_codon:yes gene_type:complete